LSVTPAFVGARVVDSLPFSQGGTAAQARALREHGADGLVGYLGAITTERVGFVTAAGLGFMPVTFGGAFDGDAAVRACRVLGYPAGGTVWLDVEGKSAFDTPAGELIAKINAWANAVGGAGYMPGLYVGVPQPLTSAELWQLRVQRYWRGQGSVRDRNNMLAEPAGCGWCMTQMFPSMPWGGVLVDANIVGQDYKGRVPSWAVAAD
jgi:hypothetical protein